MSLRLKFGVLLGLLGLAVFLAAGASWWAFRVHRAEVSEPIRSMTSVLSALGEVKRLVESGRSIVRRAAAHAVGTDISQPIGAEDVNLFEGNVAAAKTVLKGADAEDWKIRTGTTSLRNLERRLDQAGADGVPFVRGVAEGFTRRLDRPAPDIERNALASLDGLHVLIERIEAQIIADSVRSISANDRTAGFLTMMLVWSVVIAGLSIALGLILFRRWVLTPVEEIRRAAAKLASGDFDYRIPLPAGAEDRRDELGRLSAEVNHMAGMVKTMQDERVERERFAALGEMLGRLAHNLRNPLAGIRGLAEMTRTELRAPESATADIREYQERIISAVDRFEKWLNELLTDTKPMSVVPEPTPVVPWLTGLVDAHQPMARTLGVALTLDTQDAPPEATFDSRYLEHALSAILSNAIEATSSPQARGEATTGGAVRVSVTGAAGRESGQSEQAWTIAVGDQGHGVPPNLRESIFRPYFTTKRGGNGIGLALAMQVVKAHGGQIRVESPNPSVVNGSGAVENGHAGGKGTRFTITLPKHGPVLANDSGAGMARNGRSGAIGGQNPRH